MEGEGWGGQGLSLKGTGYQVTGQQLLTPFIADITSKPGTDSSNVDIV